MDFWHGFAVISVVHLLAAASPGPDFAYVTRQSLVQGRRAGLLASAGIALGLSIHIVYSAAGLAAVIAHSAHWMTAIKLLGGGYPHADRSILAAAARRGIPVTVHAAIGTDIHHMHASADGAALGATSYRDFETLTGLVATLEGGIYLNVGSAVILPEVFLKALSLARNLGYRVRRFTTVDLDFVRR